MKMKFFPMENRFIVLLLQHGPLYACNVSPAPMKYVLEKLIHCPFSHAYFDIFN